jgi:hypothetical protein
MSFECKDTIVVQPKCLCKLIILYTCACAASLPGYLQMQVVRRLSSSSVELSCVGASCGWLLVVTLVITKLDSL